MLTLFCCPKAVDWPSRGVVPTKAAKGAVQSWRVCQTRSNAGSDHA